MRKIVTILVILLTTTIMNGQDFEIYSSSNSLGVRSCDNKVKIHTLQFYDMSGRLVKEIKYDNVNQVDKRYYKELQKGIYILVINKDRETAKKVQV